MFCLSDGKNYTEIKLDRLKPLSVFFFSFFFFLFPFLNEARNSWVSEDQACIQSFDLSRYWSFLLSSELPSVCVRVCVCLCAYSIGI